MCFSCLGRYMELVHTDNNFEPEESFFQLFSDPRSTRLTRVHLREDIVRDKDLEAIRKQVGCSDRVPWALWGCYYTLSKIITSHPAPVSHASAPHLSPG